MDFQLSFLSRGEFFSMQFLLLNNAERLSIKWLSVNDTFSSTIEEAILLSCGFFSLEASIFFLIDYSLHDNSSSLEFAFLIH
jgi:hypothetical protein